MRHRRWLAAVGTALIVVGATLSVTGLVRARDRILSFDRDDWFWPCVGLAAWAVMLAGLVWLGGVVRTVVEGRMALGVDETARMLARTASRGLAADVRALPGVFEAQVRFTGSRERPVLRLVVVCDEAVDVALLRLRIGEGPVARFRRLVDMADLPAVVRFRVAYRKQCVV